jgi:hypothetical protein
VLDLSFIYFLHATVVLPELVAFIFPVGNWRIRNIHTFAARHYLVNLTNDLKETVKKRMRGFVKDYCKELKWTDKQERAMSGDPPAKVAVRAPNSGRGHGDRPPPSEGAGDVRRE